VLNEALNWYGAGLRCRSLDDYAHLLVINDATEQSAVAAMIDAIDRQYYYFYSASAQLEAERCTRFGSV